MSKYWSVKQQKTLAYKLGLNPNEYDHNNQEIVDKFFRVMVNAQINGKDIHGNFLTDDDFAILTTLTGRG